MYNVTDTYKTLIKQPTRYVNISGAVKLRSGEMVQFTDKNIAAGSLSITDRLNGRGDFRPGGVYSSGLSIGFTGLFAKTNDLDGAVIRLNYIIYPNADSAISEAEIVPLGRFYVDGSTIKRTRSTVRLKADDGLMLFDVPTTERSGTLYDLVTGACAAAGVSFGMTQAEFEALPNATLSAAINTSRVQTERDLLMYVGMLTGSFARMTRSGLAVEFVPLTCEKDESTNVIIPVREIAGNIRFSTDFSDDTTRIAKIFMRRNGAALYSTLSASTTGSEKLATLELDDNPLMAQLSDSEVKTALNALLTQLYPCLNRVFDVEFTGDPALEVGDYVRLRGGEIDTSRGYATGMITSQTWTFHGTHRIKCTMPSSLVYSGDDTDTAAVMLLADDTAVSAASTTTAPERVQPKSQIEKRLDDVEAQVQGNASGAVGMKSPLDSTSEIFNLYEGDYKNVAGEAGYKDYATAHGVSSKAVHYCAVAEGDSCTASGWCSHAGGEKCIASGQNSYAQGYGCIASGAYSHAECANTQATGVASHSEGSNTLSSGDYSHTEGTETRAAGYASHSGGNHSTANGVDSFSHGYYTAVGEGAPYGAAAFGRFNDSTDTNLVFMVGNGTGNAARSNAFAVDVDGNIYCNSVIQTGAAASAVLLSDEDTAEPPTYTAKSDNVVEFGGVTYTFTAAETGEYTGVITSTGKTMAANIPAWLGNTQTHNAAFMALAIMSLK